MGSFRDLENLPVIKERHPVLWVSFFDNKNTNSSDNQCEGKRVPEQDLSSIIILIVQSSHDQL